MEYRRLGSSGLKVSEVGLGGNNFGANGWDEVIYKTTDAGDTWDYVKRTPWRNSYPEFVTFPLVVQCAGRRGQSTILSRVLWIPSAALVVVTPPTTRG